MWTKNGQRKNLDKTKSKKQNKIQYLTQKFEREK